ncbi:DUF2145 domain-containing protein [Pseudoduganella namucuonensis]|uniref:DUF2145 domain-containing protein n=1 Tax=Pseudoduganella namucuonensis TaxID=1035707 RepID=A0A1I7IXS2_9BURK|nr:DUF2145 domain-containing protein [Pseudoduganella namucuonensis]SFU77688.1 hypothetical protein SAMN05216552_1009139 [Pseudoduganella namucuonensis]
MRRAALALLGAAALLAGLLPLAARAGQPCDDKPLDAQTVVQGMDLALRTRQALDDSGAQVALIARAGQDLSKYGLRYSHMALAWRDHPKGRWLVVHELNQCGGASSALYNEGLGNFFLDNMHLYQASIVIPGEEMQARLARLLASNTPRRLHHAQYNMLSYAFSTRYQNSNQWVLESYAAAASEPGQVETRAEAQAWLRKAGFQPITVEIPAATRLGARMFRANVAFDDHPFERRMAGQIDTVTVDAVVRFVKQRDGQAREITVR